MKRKQKITLAFIITGLFIFLIYVFNKLIFIISTMKELLFSYNSNYYNWRFGKIFYTKKGSGPPILLIHDTNCVSSDYEWRKLIQNLSTNHTVYTIDLLGCGRSDKPKLTYTNYLYVQLISDFIKNVIKHKTDIVATGRTSSAVIMACYIDMQLFGKLIFINPDRPSKLNQAPRYKHKLLKYLIDFPIIGTLVYNIAVSKYMIKENFKEYYYYNTKKVRKKYINAYYEAAHTGGSSSKFLYSSIKSRLLDSNIVHAVKEINNSIYIIGGEYLSSTDEMFQEYTSLNSSIETLKIKDSRHLPQLENPNELLNVLDVFL